MRKLLLASLLLAGSAFATDYTSMTLDEMLAQKGSVDVENRDAFRTEMQSKMQALTPDERASVMNSNNMGQGMKLQDGTGSGGMYGGSMGSGSMGGGGHGGGGGRR